MAKKKKEKGKDKYIKEMMDKKDKIVKGGDVVYK